MSAELHNQFRNPKDILSLLLLLGGDVVQRATAQMFGFYVQPWHRGPKVYLTPVAFSFGWVGYAFMSLTAVVGDKQLMPGPEAAKLKNDKNKQLAGCPPNRRSVPISMRIDIFDLEKDPGSPAVDGVWVIGWIIIIVQLGISTIPWALWNNWSIFFITGSGTAFALLTGSLRQWSREKWPGRRLNAPGLDNNGRTSPGTLSAPLNSTDEEKGQASSKVEDSPQPAFRTGQETKKKVVCLARGNGHKYVMILRGSKRAPNLESLATASSESLPETKWMITVLAVLWVLLLICVSGIESNTWFLIGIGALGMLQNIYAASISRSPEAMGLKMTPFATRPTIIGAHIDPETRVWDPPATEQADDAAVNVTAADDPLVHDWLEPWETPGVRGALRELEKTIPKAGIALMPEYFPALWRIDSERYRDKMEERFWKWMFKNPTLADRKGVP
jgi:hypothetical protein